MDIQVRNLGPIDSLDISIAAGETRLIAAPNEWGKSTLSRTITAMLARADDPLGLSPTEAKLHRRRDISDDEDAYATLDGDDGWTLTWRPREKVVATGGAPDIPMELTDIPQLLAQRGKKAALAWREILGGEVTLDLLKERIEKALEDEPEGERIAREVLEAYGQQDDEVFWASQHKVAEDRMRTAKRNWSRVVATCGEHEAYGSSKAANWRPRDLWTTACEGLTLSQAQAAHDAAQASLEEARRKSYKSEEAIAERDTALEGLPNAKQDWIEASQAANELRKVVTGGMRIDKFKELLDQHREDLVAPEDMEAAKAKEKETAEILERTKVLTAQWQAYIGHHATVDLWQSQLEVLQGTMEGFDEQIAEAKAAASPQDTAELIECPACREQLVLNDGRLERHDVKGNPITRLQQQRTYTWQQLRMHAANKPDEECPPKPKDGVTEAQLRTARSDSHAARQKVERLTRDANYAQSQLDRLDGTATFTEEEVTAYRQAEQYAAGLDAEVKRLERLIRSVGREAMAGVQDLPELEDDTRRAGHILQAVSATESAREQHKLAMLWARVIRLLAPDGLRAEVFTEKIQGVNTTMASIARKAEWDMEIKLHDNLTTTWGGFDIRTLSGSAKWRVAGALMLAVCVLNQCPLVMLDGADVLDSTNRTPTLLAIQRLAQVANIACVVTMTAVEDEDVGVELMAFLDDIEVQDARR